MTSNSWPDITNVAQNLAERHHYCIKDSKSQMHFASILDKELKVAVGRF